MVYIKGHKHSEETKQKMSKARTGKHFSPFSDVTKKKMSLSAKLVKHKPCSEKIKKKISLALKGKTHEEIYGKEESIKLKKNLSEKMTGKHWNLSDATKKNMRIAAFEYTKRTGNILFPRVGKNEKQILNKLETLWSFKIIRQYKVSGYFVDGYIPYLNLVIEIDEQYHDYRTEKDLIRQQNIIDELGCQFVRIIR